jgi:hypothetical protein
MRGFLAGFGAAVLLLTTATAFAETVADYNPFAVFIQAPNGASTVLQCTEIDNTDPSFPDSAALIARGQWYIGLDLGAHQAAHKLICS